MPRPQANATGRARRALVALLIANLYTLVGVLLFGWWPLVVVGIYWMETVVIGFLNIPRIMLAGGRRRLLANLPMVPFFVLHFGVFSVGQAAFIDRFLSTRVPFTELAHREPLGRGIFGSFFLGGTTNITQAVLSDWEGRFSASS